MPLKQVGATDAFERRYRAAFKERIARYGLSVEYEQDHAGRDTGVHFTQRVQGGGEAVSPSVVWFQLKGKMRGAFSKEQFKAQPSIPVVVDRKHLAFWQGSPEPTYLAVFVEAVRQFFLYDTADAPKMRPNSTGTVTLHVSKGNVLDAQRVATVVERAAIRVLRHLFHDASSQDAHIAIRDAEVLLALAREQAVHREVRMVFRDWVSKLRADADIYVFRRPGGWRSIRQHLQYMLSGEKLRSAFPYLTFAEPDSYELTDEPLLVDPDGFFGWDEYQPTLKIGSKTFHGTDHAGEIEEYEFVIRLNSKGRRMCRWVQALRDRAALPKPKRSAVMVSVAPFHKGQM